MPRCFSTPKTPTITTFRSWFGTWRDARRRGLSARAGAGVDAKLPRILNFTTRRAAAIARRKPSRHHQNVEWLNDDAHRLDMLAASAPRQRPRSVPMPQGWEQVEARLGTSANPEIRR